MLSFPPPLMPELRATVVCPKCGTRPAVRFPGWLLDEHANDPPTRIVQTYQCHRRGCGNIYPIELRHIEQKRAA